jgi:2-polyprenyl-3-methyl-5-hydroxy-6-metoxy-1,4-benzoquinol methylase
MSRNFITREACPACGARGGETLFECGFCEPPIREYLVEFYAPQGGVEFDWLAGESFTLVECAECGLIYQKHIGNDALLKRLYEHWIDPAKVFALIDGRQDARYFMGLAKQVGNVIAHFGVAPGELACLDFGMGWGHWCRVARGFGCEVAGVELSEARIAHARAAGIEVLAPDDLAERQFDFINTEQVFEHLAEPFETLLLLKKSLKPRGLLGLSVPDGWGVKRRIARGDWRAPKGSANSLNAVAPLEHINCFHYRNLVRFAARAGLVERAVPDVFSVDALDAARDLLKPWVHRFRGRRNTALYFAHE